MSDILKRSRLNCMSEWEALVHASQLVIDQCVVVLVDVELHQEIARVTQVFPAHVASHGIMDKSTKKLAAPESTCELAVVTSTTICRTCQQRRAPSHFAHADKGKVTQGRCWKSGHRLFKLFVTHVHMCGHLASKEKMCFLSITGCCPAGGQSLVQTKFSTSHVFLNEHL
eukprot:5148376-Amphidinium_carterae.2